MPILSFTFKAFDKNRDRVIEELDGKVREILTEVGGEPWVVIHDEVKKIPLPTATELTDPSAFVYMAMQEVVFMGPTPLEPKSPFREGFQPQSGDDLPF